MSRDRLPRLRPRTRRRLTAGVLAGVAVVGLVAAWLSTSPSVTGTPGSLSGGSHVAGASRGSGTTPASSATSRSSASPPPIPPLGVYAGPGNAATAEAVAAQLGGRVPYALDFLPRTSWTALTSPTWLAQRWHGAPFHLVIGVPMLPDSGGTLAQGATGAFDPQFHSLAQRLVEAGLGNAILMVGYQPDDEGTPWFVGSKAAAADYVAFWRDIRSTMAAVQGADFLFEWDAGDAGTSPEAPDAMYPGNKYVDIVATDAFDFVAANPKTHGTWSTVRDQHFGPAWMAAFAAARHKPMAIAMWGEVPSSAGGAGDQPSYVTQLLQWAATKRLAMCVLWDYQAMTLTNGSFPAADAALRQAVVPPATSRSSSAPGTGSKRRGAGNRNAGK